jgi:hypothetical protein
MDTRHLTDGELCALAIPAHGSPEALPRHLSDCLACTRALSEWKEALSSVADDAGPSDSRTERDWDLTAKQTLERIRRSPRIDRRIASMRWAVGIAAALLLAVLALPLRPGGSSRLSPAAERDRDHEHERAELSGQDQADDALLRDVARMSRAEDELGDPMDSLVPEPRTSSNRDGTL